MAEQRYEAVLADGETVTDVAARFGVSRQTVHAWLARYEAGGMVGLGEVSQDGAFWDARLRRSPRAINTNPIKFTSSIRRGRNNASRPRALTPQETQEVLISLRGMPRAVDLDLPDLVTLMLGTGCRIGEACAMRDALKRL